MRFIKPMWKYLVVSAGILCLALVMIILNESNVKLGWLNFGGSWIKILTIVSYFSVIIVITIGFVVVANKEIPKYKEYHIQYAFYRLLRTFVVWPIGFVMGILINGKIENENGFAQGILVASGILLAVSGVFITKVKSLKKENPAAKLLYEYFKTDLILSFVTGFVAIFLLLFWYAKSDSKFLHWATFAFGIQLAYTVICMFRPKYYIQ